jgi:hypothetical protein
MIILYREAALRVLPEMGGDMFVGTMRVLETFVEKKKGHNTQMMVGIEVETCGCDDVFRHGP